MTRKKFIKMLLSRRLNRNTANAMAKIVQDMGESYFTALGDFLTLCWIRAYNTWEGEALVWQTSDVNMWVRRLANE